MACDTGAVRADTAQHDIGEKAQLAAQPVGWVGHVGYTK